MFLRLVIYSGFFSCLTVELLALIVSTVQNKCLFFEACVSAKPCVSVRTTCIPA